MSGRRRPAPYSGAGECTRQGLGNRDCMNYSNHNLAYDITLFEEPRKPAPVSSRAKKDQAGSVDADSKAKVNKASADKSSAKSKKGIRRLKRRKSNFLRIAAGVVFGLIAVVIIASIIHGQVQLTELNQEIIDARANLSELQSRHTELEMKIAESISSDKVSRYATEVLNMSKATVSQKEFITLREGDKAEVILKEDKNIFERFIDAITSLWS